MATYKQIQNWVKQKYGFVPKTCWIADVKEICGLPLRKASNRQGNVRLQPCPTNKVENIKNAFRQFKMIKF